MPFDLTPGITFLIFIARRLTWGTSRTSNRPDDARITRWIRTRRNLIERLDKSTPQPLRGWRETTMEHPASGIAPLSSRLR
jgi:hypothetical protein